MSQRKSTEQFIEKAKQVHGDKYDYSKAIYTSTKNKVCIICPEHGEFWQSPDSHLQGKGCSMCKGSGMEKDLENFLTRNKINFIPHYKCQWLGKQHLDFYLPDYKIAIECQGGQHFSLLNTLEGKIILKL